MFNRYFATAVLCCAAGFAQAEELRHGLSFTSGPAFSELSTLSCLTPQQYVYTLTNSGRNALVLDGFMFNVDHNEPGAGFSFVDSGETDCSTTGSLASGASCTVGMTIQACETGFISGTLKVKAHNNGNVEYPKFAKTAIEAFVSQGSLAYVSNSGNNTVSVCAVNGDGSVGTCNTSTPNGAQLNGPSAIAVNSAAGYAYIANMGTPLGGTTLSICSINADGSLGSDVTPCTNTDGGASFFQPSGLTLNASGTVLYVTNGGPRSTNTVTACTLLADGSDLDTCNNVTIPNALPTDLIVSQDETMLYIVDYTGNVYACDLNDDGSIDPTQCAASAAGGTLNKPFGVTLSQDGSMVYIGNVADKSSTCPGGPSVSVCPINWDGTLDDSNCTSSYASCTLTMPMGMTTTSNFAYVANSNPYADPSSTDYTLSVCAINWDDSLGDCVNTDGGASFNIPTDVVVVNFP